MNVEGKNFETKETIDFNTSVRIREPEGDKHFMLTFSGKNAITCEFFNKAIGQVLDEKFGSQSVFHQIGIENNPGIHGWEIWGEKGEGMRVKLSIFSQLLLGK